MIKACISGQKCERYPVCDVITGRVFWTSLRAARWCCKNSINEKCSYSHSDALYKWLTGKK